jgi:hypothetical protein
MELAPFYSAFATRKWRLVAHYYTAIYTSPLMEEGDGNQGFSPYSVYKPRRTAIPGPAQIL